jgi:hypothetical protein
MASIDDIIRKIDDLRLDMTRVIQELRVNAAQVVIGDLSQLSDDLGLVKAGEFRSGVGEPGRAGDPFTGVRIGYPGFVYAAQIYNIVGVDADTMQFGLRASDGYAVFGAGALYLNKDGINVVTGNSTDLTFFSWRDTDLVGHAYQSMEHSVGGSYDTWHFYRSMKDDTGGLVEGREFVDFLYWYDTNGSTSERIWTYRQVHNPDTNAIDGAYTYWQYFWTDTADVLQNLLPLRIRPDEVEFNPDGKDIYFTMGQSTAMAGSDAVAGKAFMYQGTDGNLHFLSPDGVVYQLNTT